MADVITDLLAGHCHLIKQLNSMKLSQDPLCDKCGYDYEALKH